MATEPSIFAAPPRRFFRRWRIPIIVCAFGVTTVGGLIGWQMIRATRIRAELQQVIAELDRDEPGWQIEALEAARATVADDENNVPVILRARGTLSQFSYEEEERLKAMLAGLSPQVRLNGDQYRYCIDHLESMEEAVSLIQPVARMPRGRCPIQYSPDGLWTDLILINKARLLQFWPAHLLVLVHAQEGDLGAGLKMCVVNLHIASAIGDEPFLACQVHRANHVNTALDGAERLLAHGEIPEQNLQAFQAKLSGEAEHDPWPIGLRGDRATTSQAFDALAHGALPLSVFRRMELGQMRTGPLSWTDKARTWVIDRMPVEVADAHVWHLRRKTRLLRETANAPWHERNAAVVAATEDETNAPDFARVNRHVPEVFCRLQSEQARLRCALTAVAAERYRLRHRHWPDSLAALVPEFLPAIAADPFDGQPLRYKRLPDGVVIYTVGPDLADSGGNLSTEFPAAAGTDVGFRLWDVLNRGQEPRPDR